jgi:NADH:ubiquinone oxidoreductase subunit D
MTSLPQKGAGARLLRTHVMRLFRIPTDLFRVATRHLVAWLLTVSVRAIVRKVAKAEVAAVLAKHRMLLNVRALPGVVTDLHCLLVYP